LDGSQIFVAPEQESGSQSLSSQAFGDEPTASQRCLQLLPEDIRRIYKVAYDAVKKCVGQHKRPDWSTIWFDTIMTPPELLKEALKDHFDRYFASVATSSSLGPTATISSPAATTSAAAADGDASTTNPLGPSRTINSGSQSSTSKTIEPSKTVNNGSASTSPSVSMSKASLVAIQSNGTPIASTPPQDLNVWSVVATLVLHVNFQSLDGNAVRIVNERVYHLRAITPQPPPSCSTKSPFTSLLLLTVAPYPTISPLFTSAVLAVFVFVDIPVHMERVLSDLWNATISATTVIGAMAYNQRGRDAQK
ncbi:hypothetical protein CF327_g4743, partial [Tilletia walkeri]